jgi:ectoine hydroxylase-related dioxygenase (phytanoyl-CoA dioxygenase family)
MFTTRKINTYTLAQRRTAMIDAKSERAIETSPRANETLNKLESDGYVFLKNVIPISLIKSAHNYASELLNCEVNSQSIIEAMSELESVDKDKFYNFCKQMGQIVSSTQIALLPEILETIKNALKTQNVYLTDRAVFFNKIDVTRLQYDWHSEKSYFPNANEVITLWYPWLHNVSELNGTMVLAEASHKKEHIAERIPVKNGLTQMKIKEESLKEFRFVNCDLNVGDAVLFKLNLVHKTGPNTSGIPRSTLITRFTDFQGKFNSGWETSN